MRRSSLRWRDGIRSAAPPPGLPPGPPAHHSVSGKSAASFPSAGADASSSSFTMLLLPQLSPRAADIGTTFLRGVPLVMCVHACYLSTCRDAACLR